MISNGIFAIFTIFCVAVICQLSFALTIPSSLQDPRLDPIVYLNPNDFLNSELQDDDVMYPGKLVYPFALWRTDTEITENGDLEDVNEMAANADSENFNRLTNNGDLENINEMTENGDLENFNRLTNGDLENFNRLTNGDLENINEMTENGDLENFNRVTNGDLENFNRLTNGDLENFNRLTKVDLENINEMTENGDIENINHGLARSKRSAGNPSAIDMALSHTTTDENGRTIDRGVFEPFTVSSSSGGGNSLNDFRLNSYRGVGSVVYRSENRAHTVGVGATSDSTMGRSNGNSYSRPNYGAGMGYTFRF